MTRKNIFFAIAGAMGSSLAFGQTMSMPPAVVGVSVVSEESYNPARRYNARILSKDTVSIIPEVSGKILEVAFKEGDSVKKGDVLYRIDSLKYEAAAAKAKATVAKAEAAIEQAKASRLYAEKSFDRVKTLFEKKVASLDDMDNATMQKASAEAALAAQIASLEEAKALLKTAERDLESCSVASPIDGKVGLNLASAGNYVMQGATPLTTVISHNPARVSFTVSMRDFLSSFKSVEEFAKDYAVSLILADESVYPLEGEVEFIDNKISESTDSVQVYAVFNNPESVLVPGATVKVSVKRKKDMTVTAIPRTSVIYDGSGAFVYVLDQANVPAKRSIVSAGSGDGFEVVLSGLEKGERIVSRGTHKVIPGMAVVPAKAM